MAQSDMAVRDQRVESLTQTAKKKADTQQNATSTANDLVSELGPVLKDVRLDQSLTGQRTELLHEQDRFRRNDIQTTAAPHSVQQSDVQTTEHITYIIQHQLSETKQSHESPIQQLQNEIGRRLSAKSGDTSEPNNTDVGDEDGRVEMNRRVSRPIPIEILWYTNASDPPAGGGRSQEPVQAHAAICTTIILSLNRL